MGEALKSEETIREYLLGRVSDETTLEGLENLLFTDEEFCTQVELEEDGLINDYVLGVLNDRDAESFRATLSSDQQRRFKLNLTQALREKAMAQSTKTAKVTPSFFASIQAFFRQPKYVGAFAVVLMAVLISAFFIFRKSSTDELAELRSIYQNTRPTETRISEFGYAPLTTLRGTPEAAEQKRLRRIENNLIEATETNPGAQSHHALGVFYLTQHRYPDAIKEFESALKFADKDAKIHNDLGVAHFELSKTGPKEKKLEELAQSIEEFTRAIELNGNLLEALFNKALALYELGSPRQAKESWELYLQKDGTSQWADEARKNLARIESEQSLFKSEDQVLTDFLAAYRNQDNERAQKIHNETKGPLNAMSVPLQLSRRFLLAKQSGNEAEARESLDAMSFIGRFEQEQHSEFFFLN